MDILEQPLEAVAFRIHSLPEVAAAGAAAWACLAAVLAAAAAAGVWRMRSSTPSCTVMTEESSKPLELDTSPLLVTAETERSLARSSEPTMSTSLPALSPRERYTAYYHDSGCVGCCDVESDDDEGMEDRDQEDDDGVYGLPKADPFEWGVVRLLMPPMPATAGETALRYQSPRVLSGSVVRLWDQDADRRFMAAAAASRRRMGRAGAVSSF